jgi:hypothetical protein
MGCGSSKAAEAAVQEQLPVKPVPPAEKIEDASTVGTFKKAVPETVAGKETTIIELGLGGTPIRSGSGKALAEVEQILVVVDPRALQNVTASAAKDFLPPDVRAKTTAFLLVPSVTSCSLTTT